jgi:hypothetical protein
MQNPGSDAGVFVWGVRSLHYMKRNGSSFRDAPLGAGPESIFTIVVMDSGLDAAHRPGMTKEVKLGTDALVNPSSNQRPATPEIRALADFKYDIRRGAG